MNHWALQYINLPWTPIQNCWWLCEVVQERQYARKLPHFEVINPRDPGVVANKITSEVQRPQWQRLEKPVDGCMVALSTNRVFHHVGVYVDVDGGLVLHNQDKKGVVAQSITALKLNGWQRIEFYLHTSWPA